MRLSVDPAYCLQRTTSLLSTYRTIYLSSIPGRSSPIDFSDFYSGTSSLWPVSGLSRSLSNSASLQFLSNTRKKGPRVGANTSNNGARYSFTRTSMPSQPTDGVQTPSRIHFATGNNKKLQEVVAILADGHPLPFEVDAVKLELPELQGEPEDIAKEKCRLAAREVGGAVMVEDTCLCFNALKGLPGPYIKWFLDKCGHDGLNKMLDGFDDRTAYAQCTFAYTPGPEYEPRVFVGRTAGSIVPARGPTDFGWDPIFQPEGFEETYAEMDKSVKNTISHRYRALDALRAYLLEHASSSST